MMHAMTMQPSRDVRLLYSACPSCGAALRFARTVPRTDGLAELHTLSCRDCSRGADGAHDSECVITDLQRPGGMTGMDLQDRLIADGYRRPIIFMSALSAEDAGATAASRFLRKPFSDERLIDCLDQALKYPRQIAGDPEQNYVRLDRSAHY